MTTLVTRIAVVCALAVALAGCSSATDEQAGTPGPKVRVEEPSPAQEPEADVEEPADQNAALDAYVAQERATIPAIMEATPGMYSALDISAVYPDTVQFAYTYAEALDAATAVDYFDGMTTTFQELCDSQVFPAMERAGVTGSQKVTYTYDNADGSELWSHTFESP